MKTLDFPAGHSMDTDWFAVDKNGNIAVFESGGEGPVPIEIDAGNISWHELFENYTTPLTPYLKQLFLDEKVIENILKKCSTFFMEKVVANESYIGDACILLLNEGQRWEDLKFEEKFEKDFEFVLQLSPIIPLFLVSDCCNMFYEVREELINAINNKIIIKGCIFDPFTEDNNNILGMRDFGLYFFDNEPEGCYVIEPYRKIFTPQIPLKANQFAPGLEDEIPHFVEIEFDEKKFIQPMEYFSCNHQNSYINNEEGYEYAMVISSEKKLIDCLLPVSDTDKIYNQNRLSQCNKCYPEKDFWSSGLNHHKIKAYNDYPPIVFIGDYFYFHQKKMDRPQLLFANINTILNLSKHDSVITYCIKCFDSYRDKKEDLNFSRLFEKFQKCHEHFTQEISALQPLLLIGIGAFVTELLKTKYEISGFTKYPCLCNITITEKQYPLLLINNADNEEEQLFLQNFISEKSIEKKNILTRPRNIPSPKPRVILTDYGIELEKELIWNNEFPVNVDQNIVMQSLNDNEPIMCDMCCKVFATQVCITCMYEENAYFCDNCAIKHAKKCTDFNPMPVMAPDCLDCFG